MSGQSKGKLATFHVPVNIRLSLLWTALMWLYIYNDYFSMYMPGNIQMMIDGIMGPLGPATDGVMIGVSMILVIPSLMIFLSAVLPPVVSKWSNIVFGLVYTAMQALTFIGSKPFYQIVVIVEILVTLSIVWSALRWPREDI